MYFSTIAAASFGWEKMLNFFRYVGAYLIIICSGFLSSKCIRAKTGSMIAMIIIIYNPF